MNRKIRRAVAFVLITSALAATGCSNGAKEETASDKQQTASKEDEKTDKKDKEAAEEGNGVLTPTGTLPIVKEGEELTLSMFGPLRAGVKSYDAEENDFTAWLEQETGLTIDIQSVPLADKQAKLNVLMTSGNYPEVILDSFFSASEQLLYGQQGVLIPLNDLIDQHAPNLKKVFEEYPLVKQNMTSADGNIYSLPSLGLIYNMQTPHKMWVNKVWLDKLGLEPPTTTEEFKEMLIAFRDKDPNGNGIQDEIPLTGSMGGWNTDPNNFLINSFTYYDKSRNKNMFIEEGEFKYSKAQDGWREAMKYLNELYEENLLDPLTYSQSADQLKKVANQPGENIVGVCGGGFLGSFINVADSDRWKEYISIAPLEGPDGTRYALTVPQWGEPVLNITNKCENPEAVIRLFDMMFAEEAFVRNAIGIEGEDYEACQNGELNPLGEPARYNLLTGTDKGNRAWNQLGPWYRSPEVDLWFSVNPDDSEHMLYPDTVEKYIPYKAPDEFLIPNLGFDETQARTVMDIELPLNTYTDQMTMSFILGEVDVDEAWDGYIQELDNLGLQTFLDTYQEAYENRK